LSGAVKTQLVLLLVGAVVVLYASTTSASYSTIFVVCYAAIYFGLLPVYRRHGHLDLFSPFVGIPVLLLLYSWGSGLYVDATGRTPFEDLIGDKTRVTFYASCLIGMTAFVAGSLIAQRASAFPFRLSGAPQAVPPWWYLVAGLVGLAFLVFFFPDVSTRFNPLSVESYYDTALESRVLRMQDLSAGVREVFTVYPAVVLLLSFGAIATLKPGVSLFARTLGVIVLALYVSTHTLSGGRHQVVTVLLLLVVYYHYHRKPVPFVAATVAGGALYLFVNLITVARRTADPIEMLRISITYITDVGASGFGLAASGELVTGANLHKLIEGLNGGLSDYMYGRNIITELLVFVPRALYPDRPNSLAEEFVAQFYPGVLEQGGGYGFFILQEGYWMLGLSGVAVSMFLFGFGLERAYRWFLRNSASDFATILYAWLYSVLVVGSVRGGLMASLKAAMFVAFPLVCLWWSLTKLRQFRAARQ
jgi:oligosaccharide repeat unit polymerase